MKIAKLYLIAKICNGFLNLIIKRGQIQIFWNMRYVRLEEEELPELNH